MEREGRGKVILKFVASLVVLGALLFGGIYFIQRTYSPVTQTPSPVVEQPHSANQSEPRQIQETQKQPEQNTTPQSVAPSPQAPAVVAPQTQPTLPHTGPSDTIHAAAVAAIFAFVLFSYLRSRQLRLTL